jgi:hypothetical protein
MSRVSSATEQLIGGEWIAERRLLGRLTRTAFAIAGILWLPLLWFGIEPQERQLFSTTQYQLYLLLLTLWGYDYRRQMRRAEYVLQLAVSQAVAPQNIGWDDVLSGGRVSLFDVLRRRRGSRGWFAVVFTWCLLVGSYALLSRQVFRMVAIIAE